MIVVTDDPLALFVALGLMTPEQAERVDALAEEVATRLGTGELTPEQASAIVRTQATADAEQREPS